jgi:integrase
MANRILARVSRLFSFAVERDWIEANPALRIGKPAEREERDRVLSRDELRELWTALHQTEAKDADGRWLPRLSQTLNDALIVMLLTAQLDAMAGGRPGAGMVDDSGDHLEESGPAPRAVDGSGSRYAPAAPIRR